MPDRRHSIRIWALAALLCTFAQSRPAALEPALDLPAFLTTIDAIVTRVASADQSSLHALGQAIPVRERVRGDGYEIEVTFVWIHNALEDVRARRASWTSVRATVLQRLAAIRAEAAGAMAKPPAAGADHASETLSRILSREEFRRTTSESAFVRLRRWIGDQFDRVWQMLGGSRVDRNALAVALAWIAGIAALVTLVSIVVRMLVRRADYARVTAAPPGSRRLPARAWALRARAAQDPRELARCAYRAAVVRLEEEGVWREDASRTAREHLRLLPPDHRRLPPVKDIAMRFEQIWYAARPASSDDAQTLIARLRELGCLQPSE